MDAEHVNKKMPARREDSPRAGSFFINRSIVIGLTGGIATGKSTVAKMFSDLGAKVLSADDIVHDLLNRKDIRRMILEEFGEGVFDRDGTIDRKKLGSIVFSDSEKKIRLEAIIHPYVLQDLAEEAERFRGSENGVLILEIPLLIETSFTGKVDKVIVVTAEQETQINRLVKRYGICRDEALQRIKSQLPLSQKVKFADWVINTDGTLVDTQKQINKVWDAIQKALAY